MATIIVEISWSRYKKGIWIQGSSNIGSDKNIMIQANQIQTTINPLLHGLFSDPYFKVLWEPVHPQQKVLQDFEFSEILSEGQKTKGGWGRTAPPPHGLKG